MSEKKNYKKIISIAVTLLVVLLAVFIVLKVAFGSDKDIKFSDENITISDPKEVVSQIPSNSEEATVMAENSRFTLEYTPLTDLIVLTDKESGEVYRSYPDIAEGEVRRNNADLSSPYFRLTSPIVVRYTANDDSDDGDVGINQLVKTKVVNKIADGLQLVYTIDNIQTTFVVEFTINEDGLKVTLPRNGIDEFDPKGEARLLAVSFLPYFLSNRDGDTGYYVIPDGSGSLTYFNQPRLTSFGIYEKRVYGYDMTFDTQSSPDYTNMTVSIPMAGRVIENDMITMYATEGQANAALVMVNPGKNSVPFYGLNYKFHLRQVYRMFMSQGDSFDQYEDEFGIGDAVVQYKITHSDKELSYVDMASEVRTHLLSDWAERYDIANKEKKSDSADVNINIFLAAENKTGGVVDSYKVLTTLSQVKEIYAELESKGVKDVRFNLIGWQEDGYYGNCCDKFPVDSRVGGADELEKILAWADEKNIEVSLDYNAFLIYGSPENGVTLRNGTVKKPGTKYLNFQIASSSGTYRGGGEFFVLGPLKYEKSFLEDDIAEFKDLNVKSINFASVGDTLFTDYNKSNALTRQQTMYHFNDWLKKFSNEIGTVSINSANDYAVAAADKILDLPNNSSSLQLVDEQIPFLQLIYHGMIDYYCSPINRADNETDSYLKAIEYGSLLSYELTYNSTEGLKYTYYDRLFKSKYDLLSDDIAAKYEEAIDLLESVRNEQIVDHKRLDGDKKVYMTEYSNGIKVYVNYENSVYISNTAGIDPIPAKSYYVVRD